eukprot:TRINITY_DN8254_c0_g1_i1.p1 TRINITY_DN8254_c0_g1~~TRINITY_DN8254_c0_g1_i1.p1  ORF type:complete len:152 (+),score=33.80 TRINITY_DN8254_c0_g1_i1:50-505(+)
MHLSLLRSARHVRSCIIDACPGRSGVMDRQSAFWAFRYVENLANLRFNPMIADVHLRQAQWEARAMKLRQEILAWYPNSPNATRLTEELVRHGNDVIADWWKLADELMVKFADGFVTTNMGTHDMAVAPGYPAWWLKSVGYAQGPPPVPHY